MIQVLKVHKVNKVIQVIKVHTVQKVIKVIQVLKVHKVNKVHHAIPIVLDLTLLTTVTEDEAHCHGGWRNKSYGNRGG